MFAGGAALSASVAYFDPTKSVDSFKQMSSTSSYGSSETSGGVCESEMPVMRPCFEDTSADCIREGEKSGVCLDIVEKAYNVTPVESTRQAMRKLWRLTILPVPGLNDRYQSVVFEGNSQQTIT